MATKGTTATERLHELAVIGAMHNHRVEIDSRHGRARFDVCQHPDCVLVRDEQLNIQGDPFRGELSIYRNDELLFGVNEPFIDDVLTAIRSALPSVFFVPHKDSD